LTLGRFTTLAISPRYLPQPNPNPTSTQTQTKAQTRIEDRALAGSPAHAMNVTNLANCCKIVKRFMHRTFGFGAVLDVCRVVRGRHRTARAKTGTCVDVVKLGRLFALQDVDFRNVDRAGLQTESSFL
jgi:hypothetical protein